MKNLSEIIITETQKEILEKVRELYNKNEYLGFIYIKKNYPEIYISIKNNFKTRYNFFKLVGFSSEDINSIKEKQKLIRDIKKTYKKKTILITPSKKSALYQRACELFGDWETAISKTGIKSDNLERIIKDLKNYELKGTNLSSTWITSKKNKSKKLKKLYRIAENEFGSWRNLLSIAGINSEKYMRPRISRSKEDIKKEIIELNKKGVELSYETISKHYSSLCSAACRYFGSWKKAVEESGFDYKIYKKRLTLTSSEIISEIKKLAEEGKRLDVTFVEHNEDSMIRRVYRQARKRFKGGWKEAVEKAGLDYNQIKLVKPYNKKELIEKIKELGETSSLKPSDIIKTSYQKYYHAIAKKYKQWDYCCWKDFLKDVEIATSEDDLRTYWKSAENLIAYLNEKYPTGIITAIRRDASKENLSLQSAIRRYFGNIETAAKASGLVYSRTGKIDNKRLKKNPLILDVLYKKNKEFLETIAKKVYWTSRNKKIPTFELEDLVSEAFMIFYNKLTQKPSNLDLRRFMYPNIYWGLVNMNKKYSKEIPISENLERRLISDFKEEEFD